LPFLLDVVGARKNRIESADNISDVLEVPIQYVLHQDKMSSFYMYKKCIFLKNIILENTDLPDRATVGNKNVKQLSV
jgi:hypothetical protein